MFVKIACLNLVARKTRTFLTILAIGISVASVILLVSVAITMNQENAPITEQTDFWVIPAGSGVFDPVTNSEKTMLGNVHQRVETIKSYPDVKSATPILNKVLYATKKEQKVILGVGIIPDGTIIPPDALSLGDPGYYSEKNRTFEAAINQQLSNLLGVNKGDYIYLNVSSSTLLNSTPFKITSIIDSAEFSTVPVAILHLSELQELTGNLKGDRANQIIISGKNLLLLLHEYFPDAIVLSETEYYAHSITDDKRTLATAIAITVVSFVLGVLFISSAMIFSINEKQKEFATMRAIGISDKSIIKIVMYESIIISIIGGVTGVVLGFSGRYVLNYATLSLFGIDIVSYLNPIIIIVAFFTALIAGVISGIIPALLGRRTDIVKVLGG